MKSIKILIKVLLGFSILGFLVWKGGLDFRLVGGAFGRHPNYILIAVVLFFTLSTLAGFRWMTLAWSVGVPLPWKRGFSLHMIGLFFVTLIPGGTGGDLVKGYYLFRDTPGKRVAAIGSIVMDRVLGAYALIFWGLVGIGCNIKLALSNDSLRMIFYFYSTLLVVATLFVILFFAPLGKKILNWSRWKKGKWKSVAKDLSTTLQLYRGKPWTLFLLFLFTLFIHSLILLVYYFTALSLDISSSLRVHLFAEPILTLVNGVPIAPAGIGVGEAAGIFLYNLLGVDKGGEILVLFHIIVIFTAFLGAPFYFLYRKKPKMESR